MFAIFFPLVRGSSSSFSRNIDGVCCFSFYDISHKTRKSVKLPFSRVLFRYALSSSTLVYAVFYTCMHSHCAAVAQEIKVFLLLVLSLPPIQHTHKVVYFRNASCNTFVMYLFIFISGFVCASLLSSGMGG